MKAIFFRKNFTSSGLSVNIILVPIWSCTCGKQGNSEKKAEPHWDVEGVKRVYATEERNHGTKRLQY